MNDRFSVAQNGHVVNILPPEDVTGGKTSQAFSMAGADKASIILQIGASAAATGAITLQAGTATAAVGANVAGAAAIPFDLYMQETAGASHDVLGGIAAESVSGFVPSANDNIFYVLEINAADLPAGSPYVQLCIANTTNPVIASAVAILSGLRYAGESSATVTA